MEKDTQTLIDKAKSAMDNAYCPYSRFAVGCVLVTESGKEYTGCNIENASYGATLCAERVAKQSAKARESLVRSYSFPTERAYPYLAGYVGRCSASFPTCISSRSTSRATR